MAGAGQARGEGRRRAAGAGEARGKVARLGKVAATSREYKPRPGHSGSGDEYPGLLMNRSAVGAGVREVEAGGQGAVE